MPASEPLGWAKSESLKPVYHTVADQCAEAVRFRWRADYLKAEAQNYNQHPQNHDKKITHLYAGLPSMTVSMRSVGRAGSRVSTSNADHL